MVALIGRSKQQAGEEQEPNTKEIPSSPGPEPEERGVERGGGGGTDHQQTGGEQSTSRCDGQVRHVGCGPGGRVGRPVWTPSRRTRPPVTREQVDFHVETGGGSPGAFPGPHRV